MPAAGEKAEGIAHGAQKQDAGSVSISAEDSVTDITSKTSNDDKPELACSDKPQAEREHACAPELENKSGQTFDEDHKNKNEEPVTDKGESAVQAMNDATADKIPATTPTLKRARNDDEPEAEKKVRSATSDETQEKSPPARTQPAFAAFATRPKDPATPSSSVGFSAFSSASKPFEKASGISALAEKSDKWTEAPPAAPTEQAKTDNVVRIKSVRLPEVDRALSADRNDWRRRRKDYVICPCKTIPHGREPVERARERSCKNKCERRGSCATWCVFR